MNLPQPLFYKGGNKVSLLPKPAGIIDDLSDEVKKATKSELKSKKPAKPLGYERLSNYPDMDDRVKLVMKRYVASWNPKAQVKVAKDLSKTYGADVGVVYTINEVGEALLLFFGGMSVGAPYLILAAPLIDSEPFVIGSYIALKKQAKKGKKKAVGWFRKGTKDEIKAIEEFFDDVTDVIL